MPTIAPPKPLPAWRVLGRLAEVRWAVLSVAAFAGAAAGTAAGMPAWVTGALWAGCYASGGWGPALGGLRALRGRRLDVDVLMVAAALAAAAIGQILDGGLLIVIFATSAALEEVAATRTAESVRALLDLAPEAATRLDAGGAERTVAVGELVEGDVILVRPGERIGADGVVIAGASDVDQATVTGESLPADKAAGDEVFAGTLNGSGSLTVRVTARAHDSVVARIVAMVEAASATKATTQLLVERVEQRYSAAMVTVTVALLAVPVWGGAPLRPALLRAMTFMIVASPCGVVLATMPPLLSAVANAGRHGVLVKSAVVMERLAGTTRVAFDKTGTVTTGRPRVTAVRVTGDGAADPDELLALAAAAERASEHPLGRAIVAAAADRRLASGVVEAFRAVPGAGVTAHVDGRRVTVRRPGPDDGPAFRTLVDDGEPSAWTTVVVEVDGRPAGAISLADQVRPDASRTVDRLTSMTGAPPVLLTGDHPGAAAAVAAQLGIRDVRAGLLPDAKVAAVRGLQTGGGVLLVGDGVNDAPAMAAADLGMAMGATGSDLALATADSVLVGDDLAAIPAVIALSRRARRLVVENLAFAAAVIVGLVTWDLAGHIPLPLGVAGHEGSTVIIGLNGLRLLRGGAWDGGGPIVSRGARSGWRRPGRRPARPGPWCAGAGDVAPSATPG